MEAQAIAYTANYASAVFKILIECLEKMALSFQVRFRKRYARPWDTLRQNDIGWTMCCSLSFGKSSTINGATTSAVEERTLVFGACP